MGYFETLISKGEGETLQLYVHSFESSRNSTTNLKESQYAAATNVTCIVRSQPSSIEYGKDGVHKADVIVILTKTAVTKLSVVKWNNKYYDIVLVEEIYWSKRKASNLQYYKATCKERIEWMGS